jgi:cell division protein FtsL
MTPGRAVRAVADPVGERHVAPPRHPDRPSLTVVSGAALAQRRLRRRGRAVLVLAALVVAAALLVVAAGQAFVAAQQVRLDRLDQQLSASVAKGENLQLTRAQLESPSRILSLAEHQLGMVVPVSVTYLVPVDPGAPTAKGAARNTR